MNKIIVALDVPTESEALRIVESLGDEIDFYKVGLQLLTAAGPDVVKKLVAAKKRVFLDLKLFEIPNSVKSAVVAAGDLGVSMVTVHASGGREIMMAATKAAKNYPGLQVLALTVVTSLTNEDLRETGINSSREEQVLRLAKLAKESGCDGLICSPLELHLLRKFDQDMILVTPGVRMPGDDSEDQKNADTPASALQNGASFIVLGRSIIQSADPIRVIQGLNFHL